MKEKFQIKDIKNLIEKLVRLSFSMLCGAYFVKYMRLPECGIVWVSIFAIIFYLFNSWRMQKKRFLYVIFSGILSMAIILGYHMELYGEMYTGLMYENYMTSLTINDLMALLLLTITITAFLEKIVERLEKKADTVEFKNTYGISNKKTWLGVAFIIFAAWLPYLIVYYPGFIFGDSLGSIAQAVGGAKLYNHHPIFYTLFLKGCLNLGIAIKDITFGCAIYTAIQMIYIALCLGYQICWIRNKGVSVRICTIIVVFFGCTPFFAQNSIAMWKDPIFSATLSVWTILFVDYILSNGEVGLRDRFFWIKNGLLLVVLCFSRNNGFYIGLFCEVIIFVVWLIYRKKAMISGLKKLMVNVGCILLIVGIITGPVYTRLGLNGEPVESLGIFLNQMARVVAYDGDMSESDKDYMGNLLPLEKYKDTYRPCVVDRLKWDEDFSQEYLNEHLDGFVKTYISMFCKNPYAYVEAWALNTYGYWAINRWELNMDGNNIYKGNLGDIESGENYGIIPHNLLENQNIDFKSIIKIDDATISLAILTWLNLFVVLVILVRRKWIWSIAMAPTLGLIATLFIATPYAYWQRYGLAQYFLLPIYIFLIIYLVKQEKRE